MSEERRVTREGIHIPKEVAEAVAIEEELDSNVVGPYRFPDPSRRRIAAAIYAVLAALVALIVDPLVALVPGALAAWHLSAAWPLRVEQEQALPKAAAAVDFPIGHSSAALTFRGLRARPQWSVILYSAAEPPDRRALVTLDAVTGEVIGEPYVEEL